MANKIYGGVNGAGARQITSLYGGSNSGAQRIIKLYGWMESSSLVSVAQHIDPNGVGNITAFDNDAFVSYFNSDIAPSYPGKIPERFELTLSGGFYEPPRLYFTDGTLYSWGLNLARYLGYVFKDNYIDAQNGTDTVYVNPNYTESKLIHQGFGRVDYGYGAVIYYTDSSHTSTASIVLETSSSVSKLSGFTHQTRLTWDATIGGTTISNKDIYGVLLTEKVTTLPSYFLSGCDALNSNIILPKTLTAISDSGETTAGSAFLSGCKNMTSVVDVGNLDPSVVKSITSYSFAANDSTAPAYTQGIKIAGANRAAWLTAFPNRSAPVYRKLVDAGY